MNKRSRSARTTGILTMILLSTGCAASPARQALQPYRQAVKARPAAETYYELGAAAIAVEEYKVARKALQRSLALDGTHIEALMKLAQVYDQLEEPMKANETYRRILTIDAKHQEASYRLGSRQLEMIIMFEVAGHVLFLTDEEAELTWMQERMLEDWRFKVRDMVGMYNETLAIWKTLVQIEAGNAGYWANLGVIANLTNNMDSSKAAFQLSLRYEPEFLRHNVLYLEVYQATLKGQRWYPSGYSTAPW